MTTGTALYEAGGLGEVWEVASQHQRINLDVWVWNLQQYFLDKLEKIFVALFSQ